MIYVDPVTRQRVTYQPNSGDLEYNLIGGSAITTQVVSKVALNGLTGGEMMNLGQSNAFFGSDEALEGVRFQTEE